MNRKDMTVLEHIMELRKRLIIVIVFFVIAVIVGLFTAEPIIKFLQHADLAKGLTMNAFRITDPMKVYFQMSFVIACILTSPILLYQLWAFISPGLYEKERKVTLSYIPATVLLFLLGIAFSYFVLFPFVLRFMTNLSEKLGIHQVIGINEYFHFLFQLTIPFGLLFELPIVVMFLTRLGIVTPKFLAKIRRYAYFVLLVIAGIITPPDVLSQLIVTIPLCFLYEVSIWISRISYKKMQRAERQRSEEMVNEH
ncbi:MAG: twin-arginine translocase subunit TatC [Bacillales bacterium]|nr:twin-arginine translocase subunit TatC [Bacillales bacterium]